MSVDDHLEALRSSVTKIRSASDSIANSLLKYLLSDTMKPGDRLPSERRLAEALGVGRSAIREAIAALEVLNIVETRVGSGTYLRSTSSELLPQSLSWGMLVNQESTEDLAVVRAALERSAAELAARTVDDADRQRLRELVRHQEAARGDAAAYVEADVSFHQHIATVAGNPILEDLLSTSRSLLRVWFENAVDSVEDMDAALREHTEVAEAIAAGDSPAAGAAMRAHMETATARVVRSSAERSATA